MNFIFLFIETIIVFLVMILFYRVGKKDGLFLYISFMASLFSTIMFKSIDILTFEVNLGIPLIMGIYVCSNIIIQKYGIDEVKDIIKSFVIPYFAIIIISLVSLISSSEYNMITNNSFDGLFGYNLTNVRLYISALLSIGFTLWYNVYVYYYIRKIRNKYYQSNIGSMLLIQFLESILFVFISYIGSFEISIMFGMIVIRYFLKIVIGIISLLPVGIILKMKA